jgi:hypothetical protein
MNRNRPAMSRKTATQCQHSEPFRGKVAPHGKGVTVLRVAEDPHAQGSAGDTQNQTVGKCGGRGRYFIGEAPMPQVGLCAGVVKRAGGWWGWAWGRGRSVRPPSVGRYAEATSRVEVEGTTPSARRESGGGRKDAATEEGLCGVGSGLGPEEKPACRLGSRGGEKWCGGSRAFVSASFRRPLRGMALP